MTTRMALALGGLVLAAGAATAQPPTRPTAQPVPNAPPAEGPSPSPAVQQVPATPPQAAMPAQASQAFTTWAVGVVPPAPAPAEPTIDQLIARLRQARQQREALERTERALADQLKDALKRQREQLSQLGIEEAPAGPPALSPAGGSVPASSAYIPAPAPAAIPPRN